MASCSRQLSSSSPLWAIEEAPGGNPRVWFSLKDGFDVPDNGFTVECLPSEQHLLEPPRKRDDVIVNEDQ